jgi:hypothetical protein
MVDDEIDADFENIQNSNEVLDCALQTFTRK